MVEVYGKKPRQIFQYLIEDCKHSITTIHHNEKHDFVFHLVNSATMEINYEDMCILQFGQSQ